MKSVLMIKEEEKKTQVFTKANLIEDSSFQKASQLLVTESRGIIL